MPKLISFDVGIKNLAYCIFDFSDLDLSSSISKKCTILDWNVLDISKTSSLSSEEKEEEEILFCSCFLSKKTTKCKKKAVFMKEDAYFCSSHAKTSGFLLPSKEFSQKSLKKLSLEKLLELENQMEEKKEEEIGGKGKKETKVEKIERIAKYYQQKSLIPIPSTSSTKKITVDLITIGRHLSSQLHNLDLSNIEYVLIENQISPIANKMKTIQGMLAQIFILQNIPNIEFISSVNKLRGFSREKVLEEKEEKNISKTVNPNYKQHKKDGILYCQQWLSRDLFCSWNSFFENYKNKQDDLADSFLQGIWYLQKLGALDALER